MSTYDFDRDIKPIIGGKVPLPNAKLFDGDVGAHILHYREMHSGTVSLPGRTEWNARFFLDYGQGGQLYGSGFAAWMGPWDHSQNRYFAVGMTFAICEHTAVDSPGANHMRGWHPARCTKCGLDMTVDSGD